MYMNRYMYDICIYTYIYMCICIYLYSHSSHTPKQDLVSTPLYCSTPSIGSHGWWEEAHVFSRASTHDTLCHTRTFKAELHARKEEGKHITTHTTHTFKAELHSRKAVWKSSDVSGEMPNTILKLRRNCCAAASSQILCSCSRWRCSPSGISLSTATYRNERVKGRDRAQKKRK